MCKLTICKYSQPPQWVYITSRSAFFSMYAINLLCRCFVQHSMWPTITRRRQLWWPSGAPWLCRYPLRMKSAHTYYVPSHRFSYRHYILARSSSVVPISSHDGMRPILTAGCPHSTECRARHSVYLWVWRHPCTQGKSLFSLIPPHSMTNCSINDNF